MSKRERKKRKRRRAPRGWKSRAEHRTDDLQKALERAEGLIARAHAQEAIKLLEPFLERHPRNADLHYYLGYAHAQAGDIWGAMAGYERAQELSREPDYWFPLVALYGAADLRAHALRALRQAIKHQVDLPIELDVSEMVAAMEQDMADIARNMGLPTRQAEKGLRDMERGQIELQQNDFPASIAASRRAIETLGDWPPSHNNLSLALFWDGQPEEAIAVARHVLSQDPDNVHALSNLIRFLTWTGAEEDARALWARLQNLTPRGPGEWVKIVDAAAILGEDESVYQLLHAPPLEEAPELTLHPQYLLAVAEANTGRRSAAQRHWKALRRDIPGVNDLLAALKAGRPGPGWAERYPYFHSVELVPRRELDEFIELIAGEDDDSHRLRGQIERFAARFPQIVLLAEKLLWEEDQPDAGISFLATLATPAAYAALRRFGLSQAGDDRLRIRVLSELLRAGEITPDEPLHVWIEGEWRDVQLRGHEISGELVEEYAPEVTDLLNQGLTAFNQNDYERAGHLFSRALELDPQAKSVYNNLAAVYAHQGKHAQAKEMFHAALEIDPLYVMARCNLASYFLDDDEIEKAQEMLEPLSAVTRFHPQDLAFYHYTQARILVGEERFDAAKKLLEIVLDIRPDYELAQDLLDRLEQREAFPLGFESFWEQQWKRYKARRAKLQTRLATPEPTLAEALPLYTKNALTGVGRAVIRWGGWSALRKAEMIERIITELTDPDNLARIVADLNEDERDGLRRVLEGGGTMAWGDFDARYDNDLEESPYWEWRTPETTMGRLRLRGLLVEAMVDGELLVVVPADLRAGLQEILK